MNIRSIASVACVAMLAACAGVPPVQTKIENNQVIDAPYDRVWEDIVGFFAVNNIPIKNIAKDSGVIYAEQSSFRNETADCGRAPFPIIPIARKAQLNVFVSKVDGKPRVTINTSFVEYRKFMDQVTEFRCESTGRAESAIIGSIRK